MDLQAMWKAISAARHSARSLDVELSKSSERIRVLQKMQQEQQQSYVQLVKMHQEMTQGTFDTSITPYCKAWNTRFALQMQKRFPLEIREIVYGFRWKDHIKTPNTDNVGCPTAYFWNLKGLRFIKPEYVGQAMALEIVTTLYKAKVASVLDPCDLHFSLSEDFFGVAFKAAGAPRTIVVPCDVDEYRIPKPHHRRTATCRHTPNERAYVLGDRQESELNHLANMKAMETLRVKVVLRQVNVRIGVIREVLDSFRHTFTALQAKGIVVSILWTYEKDISDMLPHTQREKLVSDPQRAYSLTSYFTMPYKLWKDSFRAFLNRSTHIPGQHRLWAYELGQEASDRDYVHAMWLHNEECVSLRDEWD